MSMTEKVGWKKERAEVSARPSNQGSGGSGGEKKTNKKKKKRGE